MEGTRSNRGRADRDSADRDSADPTVNPGSRERSSMPSVSGADGPEPQPNSPAGRASVTSRALSVLGTFDAAHTRQTLTEIAAAADLPLSTTHRLVAELDRWQGLTR